MTNTTTNRSSSRSHRTASEHTLVAFDALESRQLMSAAVHGVAQGIAPFHDTAAIRMEMTTAPRRQGESGRQGAAASAGKSAAPGAEPLVDSKVAGWVNFSNRPLFSSGGPGPLDVRQGQIGDCYFLSALADVAYEDPGLVRKEITQRADGTYDVYFYNGRKWVDEHVDGYLPVTRSGGLEYAQLGSGGCTWVAIMEKAFTYFRYANSTPSYTNLNGGWPSEALRDLGGGTVNRDLGMMWDGDDLMDQVETDLDAGCAVELATADRKGPLVSLHAYSVMGVARNDAGDAFLLVRNPWGTDGPNHNGYRWVSADALLPQLSVLTAAAV